MVPAPLAERAMRRALPAPRGGAAEAVGRGLGETTGPAAPGEPLSALRRLGRRRPYGKTLRSAARMRPAMPPAGADSYVVRSAAPRWRAPHRRSPIAVLYCGSRIPSTSPPTSVAVATRTGISRISRPRTAAPGLLPAGLVLTGRRAQLGGA